MKFEFELDGVDTHNLWSILHGNKMRQFVKLVDHNQLGHTADVEWLCCHIRYLEDMIATVFGNEVERIDLSRFET